MGNRYFYLNLQGQTQGPLWLAEMRRLWKNGALNPETPVCPENGEDWDVARTFVEITSEEASLPTRVKEKAQTERTMSLGVWLLILACAIFMYVVSHFFAQW
ncbi:MAG: DUF4339 domain-containing protein [Verrucomicrobiales bacterium]